MLKRMKNKIRREINKIVIVKYFDFVELIIGNLLMVLCVNLGRCFLRIFGSNFSVVNILLFFHHGGGN